MKKLLFILFSCLTFLSYSQVRQLEEGVLRLDLREKNIYVSAKLPDNAINDEKDNLKDLTHEGYFLYFLSPKFKKVKTEKYIKLEDILILLDEDSKPSYFIEYEYQTAFMAPKVYDYKLAKNCIRADPKYAIGIGTGKVHAMHRTKNISLSEYSDIQNLDSIKISYDQLVVEEPAYALVSRKFKPELVENLIDNHVIYLNGKYWGRFLQLLCTSPLAPKYSPESIEVQKDLVQKTLTEFLKKNDLSVVQLDFDAFKILDNEKQK